MDPQAPDHGLVLGALALQLGLVDREQLGEVLRVWLAEPQRSAAQLLLERGHLSPADLQRLAALADGQLTSHVELLIHGTGDEHALRSAHMSAAQTIGADRAESLPEAARTLGQTLREADSPAVRRFSGVALSELNASHQRFKLLRPHAKGGLGLVSVAHDAELDREVAVKEMRLESLSDDAVQRFMMEAKVTGQLDHPGIPPVYALGYFEDGRPFYVMRLIEGATLKQAVEDFHKRYPPSDTSRQRSLELRKLLGAFVSVCHTLRYAHSRHVLHRDIKPSNIMLGNFGETLVLDWGLAKYREESIPYSDLEAKAHQSKRRYDDPTLTGTGSVLGTPHYMSPEQARGQWESVNLRSEVYSLGATLYTVLTGKLPFSGSTREAVLEQVRQGNCRPPKEVDARIPQELDAICMKAMALQREERFATAGELASEIEHWLADEPVASHRESAMRRWQRWFKSHQTALGMLVSLLLTCLVAVVVGAVAISYEHQQAKQSWQRAELAEQSAERYAEAARHFVARFLTLNYNDTLSQVPGSESTRLTLLDEAIGQLKQWALENPDDLRLKLDIAEAFRRRSQLAAALASPDQAWADLSLALDIIEDMSQAPDTPLHTRLVLTRLYALHDMAELVEQRYGPEAALRFILPLRQEAQQLLQHNTADYGRRVARYQLDINLARQLYQLGRLSEAAEAVDGAVAQFEAMLAASDELTSENGIHRGPDVVLWITCQARELQASIAYALNDYPFAESCLDRAEGLCDQLATAAPNGLEPLRIKIDCLRLRAELSQARERPEVALQTRRQTNQRIRQLARHYPTNTQLILATAQAELSGAVQELDAGTAARATGAASNAIGAFEALCSRANARPAWWLDLARAHRVRAESAMAEGDGASALAHAHVARASLATAADQQTSGAALAAEAARIEFVVAQAELLR